MDPHQTFHKSNSVILSKMFKAIFLDICQQVFGYSLGYCVVMTVFIAEILSYFYTILIYDKVTGLLCIANLIGGLEVIRVSSLFKI